MTARDTVESDGPPTRKTARPGPWLAALCLLLFLPAQQCHFKSSDELAVFEMTRSLVERGDLDVPPLRHTAVGRDGRRFSYFAPGQAVAAIPLYLLARGLEAVLPTGIARALAGPPLSMGAYHFGGTLAQSTVTLFAPLCSAGLVWIFFALQRSLGAGARAAVLASLLLAGTTYVFTHSTYFLRHGTESALMLGAVLATRRFVATGTTTDLAWASALTAAIPLFRVPAAVVCLPIGVFILLGVRDRLRTTPSREVLVPWTIAFTLPIVIAAALHMTANFVRWEHLLGSPMIEQQARMSAPTLRGLAGLVVSPGSSLLVYSPLLLLVPRFLPAFAREHRREALLLVGTSALVIGFYAGFDGWSGLWSSPGPRYLLLLTPLLLLPLGRALESGRARWERIVLALLAVFGLWIQLVSTVVRWGKVPRLAGYPIDAPDQAAFLFQIDQAPWVVMSRLFLHGGPYDTWLYQLAMGWPGQAARPGVALALAVAWAGAVFGCGLALVRALPAASPARPT